MSTLILNTSPSWEELKVITEQMKANGLLRSATGRCFPLSSWAPTTAPGIQITFEGQWIAASPLDCLEGGMLNLDTGGHRKLLCPLPHRSHERLRLPNGREFASIAEAYAYFEAAYASLCPEEGYATLVSVNGELSRVEIPESGNFNEQQQLLAEMLDSEVNGVSSHGFMYGSYAKGAMHMLLDGENGRHLPRIYKPELLTRTLNPVATALWHEAYTNPVEGPERVQPSQLVYGPMLLLNDPYYPFDKHILAQANSPAEDDEDDY
jgi:hypothetical protein